MSLEKLFDLTGKTALITGGSRGLGLQIAEALGEMGARLVLSARKMDELQTASGNLKAKGVDAHAIAADSSNPDDIARLAAAARTHLGEIDILVNNAGATLGRTGRGSSARRVGQGDEPQRARYLSIDAGGRARFDDSSAQGSHHQRGVDRGLVGQCPGDDEHDCLQHQQGSAGEFHAYAGGRMGQVQHYGQRTRTGFFPSKMTKGVIKQLGEDALARLAPLNRLGDEEDLKGAALLFASDAGKHITGQILAVDGGATSY